LKLVDKSEHYRMIHPRLRCDKLRHIVRADCSGAPERRNLNPALRAAAAGGFSVGLLS
jgi:hypothetical protein